MRCIGGTLPCIRLGFCSHQHKESLAQDWDAIMHYWRTTGGKKNGKATEYTNQVRMFYTDDEQTLWITFHLGKLYWCFASKDVQELPDGTRIRRTLAPWSCQDVDGKVLLFDNLSGALTKVQGFRGTICEVAQAAYLIKRLNGECTQEVGHAKACLKTLEGALQPLIQNLGWKDFELLCDLIFTQAGWQRVSVVGKTQKTVDLELLSPVSARRAAVQVKSQADLKMFLDSKAKFAQMRQYDEVYFVVHSPSKELAQHQSDSPFFLLTADRLASLVVSAGLTKWLVTKVS